MKKLSLYLLGAFLLPMFFTSCDDDTIENPDTVTSIVDVAVSNPNLSILVDAVTRAGLVSALDDPNASLTVFAPTNAAFSQLLTTLGFSSVEEIPVDDLTNVLLYHVLGAERTSGTLSTGYLETLNTQGPGETAVDMRVVVDGGVTLNDAASVATPDVDADNGVIHIIDQVLLPPTIVGLALTNDNLSSLVAALTAPDNTTDFVTLLSGDGPFTVFAPTNAAFQALLDSDGSWNELTDIPVATRDAVLKYHVANGNVEAGDLTDGQVIMTLGGSNFTIDLDNGAQIMTGSGQTVDIIATDIQGTNGIVHVIDAVLLP